MFENFKWPFGKKVLTSLLPATTPAPQSITIEGAAKPINYLYRMLMDRMLPYHAGFTTTLASQKHLLLGFLGPFTVHHPRNRDNTDDYTLIITDRMWFVLEDVAYDYCQVGYTATTFDKGFNWKGTSGGSSSVQTDRMHQNLLRTSHNQDIQKEAKKNPDAAFVLIEYTLVNIKTKKRFIHAYFSYNLEVLEGKKEAAAMAEV